jgi:hypothetical protein
VPIILESEGLNLLELSGHAKACNGIALLFNGKIVGENIFVLQLHCKVRCALLTSGYVCIYKARSKSFRTEFFKSQT